MSDQAKIYRIVGWGAVDHLYFQLLDNRMLVEAVVDQQKYQKGIKEWQGVKVILPEHLVNYPADRFAILILADFQQFSAEIKRTAAIYGDYQYVRPLPGLPEQEIAASLPSVADAFPVENVTPVVGRICLWIHGLAKGGAEKQIVMLACSLRAQGKDVHLICLRPDAPHTEQLQELLKEYGVIRHFLPDRAAMVRTVSQIPQLIEQSARLRQVFTANEVWQIMATKILLETLKPQSAFSYLDGGNRILGVSALLCAIPTVVLSVRSVNPEEANEKSFITELMKIYYQFLVSFPHIRLTANSECGAASYRKWLSRPDLAIPVIPNAMLPVGQIPEISLKEIGIDKTTVILSVLRLEPIKNPLAILAVAEQVVAKRPDVCFVVLGQGALRPQLEQEIAAKGLASHVYLLGAVNDPTPYYQQASIVLVPSVKEGLCNVVMEAQLQGKVVVGSDIAGIKEALNPANYHLLCPSDNTALMAEYCLSAISDKTAYNALALSNIQFAEAHFSLAGLAEANLKLIS